MKRLVCLLALAGCYSTPQTPPPAAAEAPSPNTGTAIHEVVPGETHPAAPATTVPEEPTLAARELDHSEALRTAAIKLTGALPTLDEIVGVTDRATYEAQIDRYLADPRFGGQIRAYFRDMMKLGGELTVQIGEERLGVSLDTAPDFAAYLTVQDRPITELFTAAADTCPRYDAATRTFTPGACRLENGLEPAGVLTDPGAMAQFASSMAFRRVRWIEETFDCTRFPAEYASAPTRIGNASYVSPWPFTSISGAMNGGLVNFHDTSAVICANCHATMNHIAPLFARFDTAGRFQQTIQVTTPTPMTPTSELSHWLPAGENLAWRFGKPVNDLRGLGQTMARDPDVTRCQVARAWNWAMSKTDIVDDLAKVPRSTTKELEASFAASGFRIKPLLRAVFTHDDFVRF